MREALAAMASPRRPPMPIDNDAPFGAGDAAEQIVRILETVLVQRVQV